MRTLLLTSQGLGNDEIKAALEKAAGKPLNECIVGFVPNAGDVEEDRGYISRARDKLRNDFSAAIDIDLNVLKGETLRAELSKVDVIYVEGGNTFHLLDTARKSGFTGILPSLLDSGKVYVGVSAGSYIACPTIDMADWKNANRADRNTANMADLTGMNLVPFMLTAHFAEEYRPLILGAASHTKYPIVALYDTQAVLVEGGNYRVIGPGAREFFNGFKESTRSRMRH